jgi:GxxExxY protein
MTQPHFDPLAGRIIAAAIKVHRALGPGLFENPYKQCLAYELQKQGLLVATEVVLPVTYENVRIECGYRLDILVERAIIVEVKSIDRFAQIHTAQALTYLKLTNARQILLMNFNAPTLKAGLRSFLRGGIEVPPETINEHKLPEPGAAEAEGLAGGHSG